MRLASSSEQDRRLAAVLLGRRRPCVVTPAGRDPDGHPARAEAAPGAVCAALASGRSRASIRSDTFGATRRRHDERAPQRAVAALLTNEEDTPADHLPSHRRLPRLARPHHERTLRRTCHQFRRTPHELRGLAPVEFRHVDVGSAAGSGWASAAPKRSASSTRLRFFNCHLSSVNRTAPTRSTVTLERNSLRTRPFRCRPNRLTAASAACARVRPELPSQPVLRPHPPDPAALDCFTEASCGAEATCAAAREATVERPAVELSAAHSP